MYLILNIYVFNFKIDLFNCKIDLLGGTFSILYVDIVCQCCMVILYV